MESIDALDLYRTDTEPAEFRPLFDLDRAIHGLAEHGLLAIIDDRSQGV
ncbi:hypothetical protein [Nocardia salmonicida]|nr:hypothetical protein [Nocardia salmonicida]